MTDTTDADAARLGDLPMDQYRKVRRGEQIPPAPEPPSITNERDAEAFLAVAREHARGVLAHGVDDLSPVGLLEWLELSTIPAAPDGNIDADAVRSAVRALANRVPVVRAEGYEPDVDLGALTMTEYRAARRSIDR